jgi:hypothetical protein
MNIFDAAYSTVHDYPGGAQALGPRIGKLGTSLSAEVKPGPLSTAKFGLADALKIQALSGDHRILSAMAAELGYMLLPLPGLDDAGTPCGRAMALVAKDFGELMGELAEDIADGVVTDNELRSIETCWGRLVAGGQLLLRQLGRMNARPSGRL